MKTAEFEKIKAEVIESVNSNPITTATVISQALDSHGESMTEAQRKVLSRYNEAAKAVL